MVVGVAGKYCAGKNSVIAPLEKMGFYHIDVDKLGHSALENQKNRLIETFGKGILKDDGTINRRALGSLVFADPKEKAKLEEIVHPEMKKMTQQIITGEKDSIINAAILFEMGLDKFCDVVFWVDAPALIRIRRGMKRDNLSFFAMVKRVWAQRKMNPNKYSTSSDIINIVNTGNIQKTAEKIKNIIDSKRKY